MVRYGLVSVSAKVGHSRDGDSEGRNNGSKGCLTCKKKYEARRMQSWVDRPVARDAAFSGVSASLLILV
jgi:hypothetical protein